METVETVFRRNLREAREARRLTVRGVSARLTEIGHPILPSGITKIEAGDRGVSVGDLVALAIALDVSPLALVLPADDQNARVALTPEVSAPQSYAWNWAVGRVPLPGSGVDPADFRRGSKPAWQLRYEDHTATRAARDLVSALTQFLHRREHGDPHGLGDGDPGEPYWGTPAGLRRVLARVVAETEALIGDNGHGQRQ